MLNYTNITDVGACNKHFLVRISLFSVCQSAANHIVIDLAILVLKGTTSNINIWYKTMLTN